MTTPATIDGSAIDRLARLGGDPFVCKVLEIFLRDAPARVASAREAIAARDADGVAFCSHSLISTAGNVGATTLQESARDLERHAKSPDWDELTAGVARLEALVAEACEALRAELARRGGT